MKKSILLAFLSTVAISQRAGAVLPTGWASARALGMGNAQTAVTADGDAIFYNPAGIARISGIHWTIMDPHVGVSNPANWATAASAGSTTDQASLVNNLYGKPVWLGGGAKSAVWIPYFEVAAYSNTEAGIGATQPPNPRLNLNYFFDYGGAVGTAADFIPGFFSMGFTVRYINRTGTANTLGPASLATMDTSTLTNEFKRRGVGYGVDFGAVFRVPGPISPSASFVYRDAGVTAFSADEGAGAPPKNPSEMIAGVGVTVDVFLLKVTPAIDFRYIGWTGIPTGQNINAGVEVSLPILSLRGGVSQGYYTAGAGVDLGILEADVATWAVEMGAYPGQNPDRRYMAQVTLELGFDPFKLFGSGKGGGEGGSGGGTERRGLKRRR